MLDIMFMHHAIVAEMWDIHIEFYYKSNGNVI